MRARTMLPPVVFAVALAGAMEGSSTSTAPSAAQLVPGTVRELAAGKVLVAARGLPDPNFSETVVLLVDHGAEGTMGLVINRRSEVPIARAFPHLTAGLGSAALLYEGGPVSRNGVVGLERSQTSSSRDRAVLPDVRLVTVREELEKLIASTAGPDQFRVYVGYAGWGPGQLERETVLGSWHVFRADGASVFDAHPETLWQRQIRRSDERMATALTGARSLPFPQHVDGIDVRGTPGG